MKSNLVILRGNLTADPNRQEIDNKEKCKIVIACDEFYKDKNGEKQQRTEFVPVDGWGFVAEKMRNLQKGDHVIAVGSYRTNKWQDNNNQTKYRTFVEAESVNKIIKL